MVVVLGLQSMRRAGEHDRALLGSEVELGYSSELTQELLRFAAAGVYITCNSRSHTKAHSYDPNYIHIRLYRGISH